jgi:GAF domain-containing protein
MPDQLFSADQIPTHLRELTALLLSTSDVEEALARLADTASRTTPGHPMAGVALSRGEEVLRAGSSTAHTLMIDEIRYGNGGGDHGGPCSEAMNTGRIITVPDLSLETRWGGYPARLLDHGVRGVYSHPLRAGGRLIGALNMYATHDGLGPDARRAIAVTAEQAGVLLDAVVSAAGQAELAADLRRALVRRAVVDQALGILMCQQRCTATEAFAMLRQASQSRNRKLRDIAADIVQAVTGHPPQPVRFADPGEEL